MLAAQHPAQHLPFQQDSYSNFDFSSQPSSQQSLYLDAFLPSTSPTSQNKNHQQQTLARRPQQNLDDQFMTDAYPFENPNVQAPQFAANDQTDLWAQLSNVSSQDSFLSANGGMQSTIPHPHPQPLIRRTKVQKPARSSPTKNGHATKGFQTQPLPTGKPESYYATEDNRSFSNHLPTPSQTPTQDGFLAASQPGMFNASAAPGFDSTISAHNAMRQALMETSSLGDDNELPPFSHSNRHSVSSIGHDSPITPHTVNEDDFDDGLKAPSHDNMNSMYKVDFSDTMYPQHQQQQNMVRNVPKVNAGTNMLSPNYRIVNERLQAAQNARVQSPLASSRAASPFRQNSPWLQHDPKSDMGYQQAPSMNEQIKTISPKDAVLDYHESEDDNKAPLFPEDNFQFMGGNGSQPTNDQSFDLATSTAAAWSQPSVTSAQFATSAPFANGFNFEPTAMNMNMGFPQNNFLPRSTAEEPQFPASLPRMESSLSDTAEHTDNGFQSQLLQHQPVRPVQRSPIPRPLSTRGDSGAYSCTYHGCPQRFSTPQKLQKHKRDAHRQHPPGVTPGIGSGMSPADLMARNSQTGPHRCERINPATGKPCNSVFSRPYDLTRHEDTIHNVRKQKVRCALCVEEKTFSRSDALTRHMRVVHPEVDFPGKHRRRGGARS